MIREAHERPEGMEAGATIMAGLSAARIEQAVEVATSRPAGVEVRVADYADANVSDKVLHIVLSYVDYVRRTAWYEALE
jgi:UDP-N-acetylglucosamine 2-epimerase (non-hydrolysing)